MGRLLVSLYVVGAFATLIVTVTRKAPPFSRSLTVLVIAAATICLYGCFRIAFLVDVMVSRRMIPWLFEAGQITGKVGGLLYAAAVLALPIESWLIWRGIRRSIRPLWREATRHVPACALSRAWLLPASLRSERIVIECFDALVALQRRVPARPAGDDDGLTNSASVANWLLALRSEPATASPPLTILRTPAGSSDLQWAQEISLTLKAAR